MSTTAGFLPSIPGQEWVEALTASDLDPAWKAMAVAHAGYAAKDGSLVLDEETEERVCALAFAILWVVDALPDDT